MKNVEEPTIKPTKLPRHVAIARGHLIAQRTKAVEAHAKTGKEIDELEAALKALGWTGEE